MMNHHDMPSSPTILDAIRWATPLFESCPIESPRLNAELILAHILNLSRLDLYLKFDRPLASEEVEAYGDAVEKRIQGAPLQYITGETEFFSLPFTVTPAVLIPRPETEILVEQALRFLTPDQPDDRAQLDMFQAAPSQLVLDLGTGSGIIALTLAHHLSSLTVYASDISDEALEVARYNADRIGVSKRVTFLQGPYFEPLATLDLNNKLDLIVSNPPYIREDALEALPDEILRHEPRLALDGGGDGLKCYRRIVTEAPAFLRESGMLMMEIGADQADEIVAIIEHQTCFASIEVMQDYNQHDRVVTAVKVD